MPPSFPNSYQQKRAIFRTFLLLINQLILVYYARDFLRFQKVLEQSIAA